MSPAVLRILPVLILSAVVAAPSFAQTSAAKPAAPRIEPGLETAVNWKWQVIPSEDKDWGYALPDSLAPQTPGAPGTASSAQAAVIVTRPERYEVARGDALAIIARKFNMSVTQLKAFNGLESDTIRIGQVLKIPTLAEIRAMAPPPDPTPPAAEKKSKAKAAPKPPVSFEATREMENVLLQAFLDRENFPTGPIDGNPGVAFDKALQLYRTVHDDVSTAETLRQKAMSVVGQPFTDYTLKPEDFRFIAPPKSEKSAATGSSRSRSSKSSGSKNSPPPPLTYEELVTQPFLTYRTAWEFVAERFHCSETFLRTLNFRVKGTPAAGTEFQVPNVIPFEIEKAFDPPLQPAADPARPVTAAVVDYSRIEIYQGGKLIAALPMSLARPDLRGRGYWTVLDVLPRPRLATRQEPKEQSKPRATSTLSLQLIVPANETAQRPAPLLEADQHLAAGPNNPLGILWINLAKAKSTEPLPYGLHGTSIPGTMKTQESIGGLRLANWDIVRAVRLLPSGTPLQWK